MTGRHSVTLMSGSIERRIHIGSRRESPALYIPKRLNEQVKRNRRRFPRDFMFRLTPAEARALRSQNATFYSRHGKGQKIRALLPSGDHLANE